MAAPIKTWRRRSEGPPYTLINPESLQDLEQRGRDYSDEVIAQSVADHGYVVQRFDNTVISASQWVPLYGALTPCAIRDVALVPKTGFGGTASVYWEGRLAVSRYWNNNPVPAVAPVDGGVTGIDLLATRRADGGANAIVGGQLWRFGSVVWNDALTGLAVGDVLGVWWEKVGAAANLAFPMLYSMRMTGVGV